MIAAVDIGNTRTKLALFTAGGELRAEKTIPTDGEITAAAEEVFSAGVERAVVASVVPARVGVWQTFFAEKAYVVSSGAPWSFQLGVESPERVGVDRLLGLEGACAFPGAVIVINAGTATTFDVLEGVGGAARNFPGGAIAPGMGVAYEALVAGTAQLPRVELGKHSPVVGYNTETAIRSGVLFGFAAQIDGMVMRIFEERGLPPGTSVVATGGNSTYLQGRARLVTHYRPRLVLEGCYALAKKLS